MVGRFGCGRKDVDILRVWPPSRGVIQIRIEEPGRVASMRTSRHSERKLLAPPPLTIPARRFLKSPELCDDNDPAVLSDLSGEKTNGSGRTAGTNALRKWSNRTLASRSFVTTVDAIGTHKHVFRAKQIVCAVTFTYDHSACALRVPQFAICTTASMDR